MQEATIYIEMPGEGTRVFAPVSDEHLGGRYYKVVGHNRTDDRTLRFETGTYVLCLPTKLSGDGALVPLAYCEVSREEAEYMSTYLKISE